jgi:hypothetical protein
MWTCSFSYSLACSFYWPSGSLRVQSLCLISLNSCFSISQLYSQHVMKLFVYLHNEWRVAIEYTLRPRKKRPIKLLSQLQPQCFWFEIYPTNVNTSYSIGTESWSIILRCCWLIFWWLFARTLLDHIILFIARFE